MADATVVVVSADTTQGLALVSPASYLLSGVVTGSGGVPVSGALVHVFDAATSSYVGAATMGSAGGYTIELASGSYKAYVQTNTPAYPDQWVGGSSLADATVFALSADTTQNLAVAPATGVYESWAGAAGSLPDAARWEWLSGTGDVPPALTGSGEVVLTTPGSTTGGIIRSTQSFDGEVSGTIVAQPAGGSANVRVTVGFGVQDSAPIVASNHFPTDGYYIYINPEFNALAIYRRIAGVGEPISAGQFVTLADIGASNPIAPNELWHWAARADGANVRVWMWVGNAPRPVTPTWTIADGTFSSGKVRLSIVGDDAGVTRAFTPGAVEYS
jgi:hypothetical protein